MTWTLWYIDARLEPRTFSNLDSLLGDLTWINISHALRDDGRPHIDSISKRIWRFNAASNVAVGARLPKRREVNAYLSAVFNGAETAAFGPPLPYVFLFSFQESLNFWLGERACHDFLYSILSNPDLRLMFRLNSDSLDRLICKPRWYHELVVIANLK